MIDKFVLAHFGKPSGILLSTSSGSVPAFLSFASVIYLLSLREVRSKKKIPQRNTRPLFSTATFGIPTGLVSSEAKSRRDENVVLRFAAGANRQPVMEKMRDGCFTPSFLFFLECPQVLLSEKRRILVPRQACFSKRRRLRRLRISSKH